jgi:spore germination cell wall hydrolase CwlJ-like protein
VRWLQALGVLLLYCWLMIFAAILVVTHSHPSRAQALSTWRNSALVTLHKGDVDTLARTLYGEARGEHLEGMQAVAWVILNRAKRGAPRFPATIGGVCKQKAQFTCWSAGDPNAKVCAQASDADPFYVLAIHAASGVLAGQVPDPTDGADHYHTIGMRPYPSWAGKMELKAVIGQHRFYKE